MLLWNQVDALQKHFKKDHVHMRLWTRLYGMQNVSLPTRFQIEYVNIWLAILMKCILE